jgi:hypothetical protein
MRGGIGVESRRSPAPNESPALISVNGSRYAWLKWRRYLCVIHDHVHWQYHANTLQNGIITPLFVNGDINRILKKALTYAKHGFVHTWLACFSVKSLYPLRVCPHQGRVIYSVTHNEWNNHPTPVTIFETFRLSWGSMIAPSIYALLPQADLARNHVHSSL